MRLGKPPTKSRLSVTTGDNLHTPQHISSVTVIGRVSLDLISTVYEPLIRNVAAQQMEAYAGQLAEYEETVATPRQTSGGDPADAEVRADGETGIRGRKELEPPQEPLFASMATVTDFLETLQDTSAHFFPSSSKEAGFKIYANAAKFERMLDEKYGVFRPFITNHPQLESAIRNLQRRYAMGQWSPIRNTPPPIPRTTSIIILFMMQRGGVQWQVLLLTSLLLIVGLQPWALVSLVVAGHWLVKRRKNRAIGGMSEKIPLVDAYYHHQQDATDVNNSNTLLYDASSKEKELERVKQQTLVTPVGLAIPTMEPIDTTPYDTLILGHGPGTLFLGSLLSRAGRRVLVLSPRLDASGCLELEQCSISMYKNIPFDIEANNVSKISKLQHTLALALCTKTDCQGGIRFAKVGTEADGYAFDVLAVPGVGTDRPDQVTPFVCKGTGADALMNDAASLLGDGWPDLDGSVGNSSVGAYLMACEAINATASAYYVSKIIPENVNSLRSDGQFYESAIRHTAPFLNKCFPINAHTRSLMAAIGMKNENIKPNATSMAAHVSNICAAMSGEGMHYPIGGPRALCKALANVIEKNGGKVFTGVAVKELLFDEHSESDQNKSTNSADDGPPSPRCLGFLLQDGRKIRFDKDRYKDGSTVVPTVISCVGLIDTFIRLLNEDTRTKYKVPRGLPALSERRPVFKVLYVLKGTANDFELTGADFYRLPSASIGKDRVTGSGEVVFGEIGGPDDCDEDVEGNKVGESVNASTVDSEVTKIGIKKKSRRAKFQAGESWIHITFPSCKDPSFASRHGNVTTCVVTVEADDDFVTAFDTKPKLFLVNKETAATPSEIQRLLDRVTRDLLETYPQLRDKIECSEVRGPFQKGLSHNPERYAAKGVRPETPYPQLYVGGSDLTIGDSFAGEIVAGWLVANQIIGYSAADHLFLQKNLSTDLEMFLEQPSTSEVEDLAVPLPSHNDITKSMT